MRSGTSISHPLRNLSTLWIAFVTILLVVAIGLGLLSRHALRLQSQQTTAQHRERLLQNVRIALWRIDSRLAPYIATIHQVHARGRTGQNQDPFIRQRFRIVPDDPSESRGMVYLPDESRPGLGKVETDPLEDRANIDALLLAVRDIVPVDVAREQSAQVAKAQYPVQSKSQRYVANAPADQQLSQSGLKSRAAVVQNQVAINQLPSPNLTQNDAVIDSGVEPQMLSVWIDKELAVVRSQPDGRRELEGVWIDWNSLHRSLIQDIFDLLPKAIIRPATQDESVDPEYALASLPAVLVPGKIAEINDPWSPTHTALLLSWSAFLLSAILAGFALHRLIALSERRAAFVSAVTHELRTPLTTFRLYSDLLARGMVTDPSDRQSYVETLRREADRLTHLVDNVLRYSRLERTSTSVTKETVVVSDWIKRISPRLSSRLAEADLVLDVQQLGDGQWSTDPPAMEQVLFNLIDNAAKYAVGANDDRVHLRVDVGEREVVFVVSDHGDGVPQTLRKTMFQPFSKSAQRAAETAAGVGLGLALVKRTVAALGGEISYQPSPGGGAEFCVRVARH